MGVFAGIQIVVKVKNGVKKILMGVVDKILFGKILDRTIDDELNNIIQINSYDIVLLAILLLIYCLLSQPIVSLKRNPSLK